MRGAPECSGNVGQKFDEPSPHQTPAVARTAEVLLLLRLESSLHERQPRARLRRREGEGDDGVQIPDGPTVAQLSLLLDLEELAVHASVPAWLRWCLERELRARRELQVHDRQQPLREQRWVGKRTPHFCRRMMQVELECDRS